MRNAWKKVMAAVLAAVMVLGMIPVLYADGSMSAEAETIVLGRTTKESVNVRKSASTASDYWLRLPLGYVCTVLDQTSKKDEVWYKVKGVNPYSESGRGFEGYILGTCLQILSEAETAEWLANPIQPGQTVKPTDNGGYSADTPTGRITNSGVNFRVGPSLQAGTQGKLDRGMVVLLLTIPAFDDPDPWYNIQYDGKEGYVQGLFLTVINSGNLIPGGGKATATPRPDVTPGPETAAPTPVVTPEPVVQGYVKTTKSDVNLRMNPAGTVIKRVDKGLTFAYTNVTVLKNYTWYYVKADGVNGWLRSDCVELVSAPVVTNTPAPVVTEPPVITETPAPTVNVLYVQTLVNKINFRKKPEGSLIKQVNKDLLLLVTGTPEVKGKYTWYPVVIDGVAGYLREDVVKVLKEGEIVTPPVVETPVPTPTPTAAPVDSGYVMTTMTSVNLRSSASKDASSKAQVKLGTVLPYTASTVSGGQTWYKVTYEGTSLWVLGTCVHVMTQAEYEQYIAGTATPTPTPITLKGYVKTTTSGLNVRSIANGADVIGRISEKGTVVKYYNTEKVGTTTWYYVETADGMGWINGTYVKITDENGNPVGTVTPTPVPTETVTPGSYSTLKLGSTGPEVTNLVKALKAQGYYTGEVTDTYTSAVKKAVEAFQKANGLTVDGIAGATTQEILFGSKQPDDENYMKLYKPEKIDWYTGGIQELLPKGADFKIYDVYTGIVWQAHRWSGGDHADIEPLTAEDTAKMCKMYGVSKADEISSKDLWQRRPSLVTIGEHTYACSLYGEPHGTQTITTNNFPGQCCLHFTNSKTHGSKKVDSYHATAIQYAIDHAPAPN